MADLDKVKYKVQQILAKKWNVRLGNRPNTMGDFILDFESTRLQIMIDEYQAQGDDSVIVTCAAPILYGVPLSDELYKWASTIGADASVLGHASIHPSTEGPQGQETTGNLWFSHTLLGDYLDPQELNWAVGAVGFTADNLDDQLQTQFGGHRAIDLPPAEKHPTDGSESVERPDRTPSEDDPAGYI